MIIPLSHDSGEVRRQPWVTYAILLTCALVFLATHVLPGEAAGDAERRLAAAYEYWQAHPYLKAPPRLGELTGDPGRAVRDEFYAVWNETGEPPVPAVVVEAEQDQLDELSAQAFAALELHPWYRFGLIPSAPTPTGLFAHMFLHGGWFHLVPNLIFLFLTGPFIEDRWGRGLYALFYVAAGVAGATLFVAKHPEFTGPLIGASGAIAGAMGAFLVRFARTNIKFFYWLGFFFGTFSAPAWLMLPLWFANELVTANLIATVNPGGGGGGVAYWAHVGGFSFGIVAAVVFRFSGIEASLSKKVGGEWTPDPATVLDDVATARGEGRHEDAFELLRVARETDPDDAALAFAFFEIACELGCIAEGVAALTPVLWREVRAGEQRAAVAHWLALSEASAEVRVEPDAMIRLAGWLREANHREAAAVALRRVLAAACGDPQVAMRVAQLARRFDPALAGEAAGIALRAAVLEPAERSALETIVAQTGSRGAPRVGDLEAPAPFEAPASPESVLDHGSVDLNRISAEPERSESEADARIADEFDHGVVDLSEDPEKESVEVATGAPLRSLRVMEAVPLELEDDALWLEVEAKGRTRLPFARVDAVAAGGVHGLSGKAGILIDLALDWTGDADEPLRVLRLRSDRYDPRYLMGSTGKPLEVMSKFASLLIARARAVPLPDPEAARGQPFKVFRDLASYEAEVLRAERTPA
jgi:membrane associated rhomboid family serine protease